jgi:hypothetical protein
MPDDKAKLNRYETPRRLLCGNQKVPEVVVPFENCYCSCKRGPFCLSGGACSIWRPYTCHGNCDYCPIAFECWTTPT